MAFTNVILTGTVDSQPGNPLGGALVTMVLNTSITDGTTVITPIPNTVVTAFDGTFSITVPANDDPTTSPTGTYYEVTIINPATGNLLDSFNCKVPRSTAPTTTLFSLPIVIPSPGGTSGSSAGGGVASFDGRTGSVVSTLGDYGTAPGLATRGAILDGVTDDSAVLQAAIEAGGLVIVDKPLAVSTPITIAGRAVADGTTNGTTTITSPTINFTVNDIGRNISGTNIANGARIKSINGPTSAVMTIAATGSLAGTNAFAVGPPLVKLAFTGRFDRDATVINARAAAGGYLLPTASFPTPSQGAALLRIGIISGRTVTDGVTAGTTTITSATIGFSQSDINQPVIGPDFSAGTKIASVTNSTTAILNIAAANGGSARSITIGVDATGGPTQQSPHGIEIDNYCAVGTTATGGNIAGIIGLQINDTADFRMKSCYIAFCDRNGTGVGIDVESGALTTGGQGSVAPRFGHITILGCARNYSSQGLSSTDAVITSGQLRNPGITQMDLGALTGSGGGGLLCSDVHMTAAGVAATSHVTTGALSDASFDDCYFDVISSGTHIVYGGRGLQINGGKFKMNPTGPGTSFIQMTMAADGAGAANHSPGLIVNGARFNVNTNTNVASLVKFTDASYVAGTTTPTGTVAGNTVTNGQSPGTAVPGTFLHMVVDTAGASYDGASSTSWQVAANSVG